ncbi:hypothetical protein [Pseudochryseolinea flava]|uniref:CD-NTase associated protein 4-like DNA endonuclease domain-containing protein n=1 Tax=Pseudochryseolinea flava TaxID=2059302 RepID=A0A364Y7W8_9BACT|nr:hypothetical protein [Pseudochryseolinea flava]RAW01960.1 hypothetical protein DQQ10_05215 [Pseudochryseolinea flava]
MDASKPFTDTTAADTSIGFDYQFYYFFLLLLNLRIGEKIGLEVKDDIHIDLSNGKTIFIQTKHSVQTKADGSIINLTERDKDLWKTLSLWVDVINSQSDKKAFLKNSIFQLITNKSNSANPVLVNIQGVQAEVKSIDDFQTYLDGLIAGTQDADVKKYMENVRALAKTHLSLFLSAFQFDLSEDNLIQKIKDRILEKIHLEEKVQDVYQSLHSALRDKNYLTVKEKEIIEYSFEDFNKHFKSCFKLGLSTKLPIREIQFQIPDDPSQQLFIKQLVDIGDVDSDDKARIAELTTHLLKLFNNLKEWEMTDGLLPSTKKGFDRNSVGLWTNCFRSVYRDVMQRLKSGLDVSTIDDEIKQKALECLDEMRRQTLKIEDTDLDIDLSNGHFYLLTEEKSIGWHYDWEKRY